MKGYKGMDAHMQCRGMQYEVGKTYRVDGEIRVCRNGLHFCERLTDVFNHYERDGNRFFEVVASGQIKKGGDKNAASELTVVRELTDIEINRAVYGDGYGNGIGIGNGYGYGDGYGNGIGNGNGYGYGIGDGNGYGDGNIQKVLLFA